MGIVEEHANSPSNVEDETISESDDESYPSEDEMGVARNLDSSSSDDEEHETTRRVYLPNRETDANVTLDYDESAYVCYYAVGTGQSCLSFDIIPDDLGNNRADLFPLTMTVIGGTQSEKHYDNKLMVMRLSNMHKSVQQKKHDDDDEESDEEVEGEKRPELQCVTVRHQGCVNRVKVTEAKNEVLAASWSEHGKVHIWYLSRLLTKVQSCTGVMEDQLQPIYSFSGHLTEGFAMEWSPLVPGVLATGDNDKKIHLWKPQEGGTWHVDERPYTGHTDSVEDIQWSPNESNVLASCSVDKTIRIWDIRAAPSKACMLTKEDAHDSDVNVISWNKSETFILSGGDDGKLRVWDLRQFPGNAICTFKYHTAPICSVEWHPTDHSVFAAAGADDILTQWDLAIEKDEDMNGGEEDSSPELRDLPPQLLFLHQGQKEIKELHWHKQMPGVVVSTAQLGLNVMRTVSI